MKENSLSFDIRYLFYAILHPVDGYYEIRHRNKGNVGIALFLCVLFSISYTMNKMFASFIVNDINPQTVSLLSDLVGVVGIFLLFCISNWSITCLANGEGRLKDIITVVGYSLVPLIVSLNIITLLSQVLSDEEVFWYQIIKYIGIAWTAILVILGIMIVHNYTSGKTILTMILTLIAMLVILFLSMMLITLVKQVYEFISSIVVELKYRI